MRSPLATIDIVPRARQVGLDILRVLQAEIRACPRLLEPCASRFSRQTTAGFLPDDIVRIRASLANVLPLGHRHMAGLDSDLIRAYVSESGDPDDLLSSWLSSGAPLGIRVPIESRGVFPVDERETPAWQPGNIASDPMGWSN